MKAQKPSERPRYRGRLAPTPTGWLHLGHAATFQAAWQRAKENNGILVYRTEDLDPDRCRPEFADGAMEDLRWWGLDWDEGPNIGGKFAPYVQSERLEMYRAAMERLKESGLIYPSPHSRSEINEFGPQQSPVDGDPLFPADLRPDKEAARENWDRWDMNWRFRVPEKRVIIFQDGRLGQTAFVAGKDFGDFLVWRKAGVPSYELAVVVDDLAMEITEVVRGEDLLLSTARQILLYEALGASPPDWYHCPLVMDPETGKRMSKTHKSLGLRYIRDAGHAPGLAVSEYFAFDQTP